MDIMKSIDDLIADELVVFSKLTPKRKASMILGDYNRSYQNARKASRPSCTPADAEIYDFHRMRFYTKAQREIKMLSSDEMSEYLSLVEREVRETLDTRMDYSKRLDKFTLFNSSIFMLLPDKDSEKEYPAPVAVDGESAIALNRIVGLLENMRDQLISIDMSK